MLIKRRFALVAFLFFIGVILSACNDDGSGSEEEDNTDVENVEEELVEEEEDAPEEEVDEDVADEEATTEDEEVDEEEVVGISGAEAESVVIYGDTVNSHTIEDAVCVVNSRFEQGQRLIFRGEVKDTELNEPIKDANVKVVLETGEEYDMVYGAHGDDGAMLYTIPYEIPEDAQTGTLNYQIIADVAGETYTYEPMNVAISKLTIVEAEE